MMRNVPPFFIVQNEMGDRQMPAQMPDPIKLKRSMSSHHVAAAAEWLSDKRVGATAMVTKMYTTTGPSRCYLTIWLEKTGDEIYVEKRANMDFQTDWNLETGRGNFSLAIPEDVDRFD